MYQECEGDIIGQYIVFSKVYNEQRKLYGNTKQAVTETIYICKNRKVLKEYLKDKEQEVIDIMMTLFDDEQILKAYTKDIEDNKERETERKTAERMIKVGKLSLDEISLCVPSLSLDELKELEAQVMQLA